MSLKLVVDNLPTNQPKQRTKPMSAIEQYYGSPADMKEMALINDLFITANQLKDKHHKEIIESALFEVQLLKIREGKA